MFSLGKPTDDAVERFRREQSSLDLTYPEAGATAKWDVPGWRPPAGYHLDRASIVLGSGEMAYLAATDALRQWRQFDVGWADVTPTETPLEPGQVVAVQARVLGLWTLHACRIVYAINEDGPVKQFGFGYGTLPGHAESGEERFLVTWDRENDAVTYDVAAFVRPRHPLARLVGPYARRLADRFRSDSAEAMRRAVGCQTLLTAPMAKPAFS